MAIGDYAELVLEAGRRSGVPGLANRADMVVGMAEDYLSKRLRLAGQETSATLTTDANGEVSLPSDFEEMRSLRVTNRTLRRLPLERVLSPGSVGWCVRGSTLVSTYASTGHACIYYASIPSLNTNDTNHLLTAEPELYLQAVIFQALSSAGEIEKASIIRPYVDSMIADANARAHMARYAGQAVHLGAVY